MSHPGAPPKPYVLEAEEKTKGSLRANQVISQNFIGRGWRVGLVNSEGESKKVFLYPSVDDILGSKRRGGTSSAPGRSEAQVCAASLSLDPAAPYLSFLRYQLQRYLCKDRAPSQPWSSPSFSRSGREREAGGSLRPTDYTPGKP